MTDDKQKEPVKKEPATDPPEEDADEEEESKAPDMVAKANEAAERLEAANKVQAKLISRQEKILVASTLGGQADAGTPQEVKEDTPAEYAQKVLKGEVGDEPIKN